MPLRHYQGNESGLFLKPETTEDFIEYIKISGLSIRLLVHLYRTDNLLFDFYTFTFTSIISVNREYLFIKTLYETNR